MMAETGQISQRGNPDNKNCFVAMPFGRTTEEARWFEGWYRAVIEPAITSAGYDPILSAAQDQPSAINDEIRSHLVFDAMAVVDLGGRNPEDPPNANVMYELGIRHAFGLPVVLLAWEGQRLPFDVGNQRAIVSRRDFLDIESTRSKLAKFIYAASQGKFYNPMEAVGREAAIEKTSLVLGEESFLAALADEVRALRTAMVAGRSNTPIRWRRQHRVKNALGNKRERQLLWQKVQELGFDSPAWSKFLSTPLTEERFETMRTWELPDWLSYARERVEELSATDNNLHRSRTAQDVLDAVAAELPEQPWPQGIHKVVAEKLHFPVKVVSKAITDLIHDGVFSNQVDGVLIAKEEDVQLRG